MIPIGCVPPALYGFREGLCPGGVVSVQGVSLARGEVSVRGESLCQWKEHGTRDLKGTWDMGTWDQAARQEVTSHRDPPGQNERRE